MKKIIIARQLDNECFNYDLYYDECQAAEDMFYAGGNRDFCEFNGSLRQDVVKSLEDCSYDLRVVRDDYTDENNEITDRAEYEEEFSKVVRYYFVKTIDRQKVDLTSEEINSLARLCELFSTCSSREENDIICEVLEILHGVKFKTGTIRGCSQGEWMDYICPETMSAEYIKWIEAVLFATGTEFMISEVEVADDTDITDVDKLIELADNDIDSYCDYTNLWCDEDIKEWIAKNASYGSVKNFTADDVKLIEISRSYMVRHNEYKII